MTTRIGKRPSISAMLMGSLAFSMLQAQVAHSAPITRTADGKFLVDCTIGVVGERCQLDTASGATIQLRSIPAFETLSVVGTRNTIGVAGVMTASKTVEVESVAVGDLRVAKLKDASLSSRPVANSVLGLPFFTAQGVVTFDLTAWQLKREGPTLSGACPAPFHATYVLKVPAIISGKALNAAWDTGANITAVDAAFVHANGELFEFVRDLPQGTDATGGAVPVRLFKVKSIGLCGREFTDVSVVTVDMSAAKMSAPDFPDLILGADLMAGHVWRFDFTNNTWSLD